MAPESRTSQFARVTKVLKKHYKPVAPDARRAVLEHLLFACCLEDAHYEAAEEAFAALVHTFFDWNEVRVTTISELSEVMAGLPNPRAAANRIKRVLQSVFEDTYEFDLEIWRKKNLGPTVKWLKKIDGTTNFLVAYVVQSALGGHAIPVDSGVLAALRIVELVSDKDVEAAVVPGLERAVSKSKGIEFGSMLHQFGADFTANPYSPSVRKLLLEINPNVKDRLPKRRSRKRTGQTQSAEQPPSAEAEASGTEGKKPTRRNKASKGKQPPARAAKKRPAAPAKKPAASKPKPSVAGPTSKTGTSRKSSASAGLSKRKPR